MLFVLRCERAPLRVVHERDERGTERTFWVFEHGVWVVAYRLEHGAVGCAHDPVLEVDLEESGGVVVVMVRLRPLAATIPAPPPSCFDGEPSVSISSVVPVATRITAEASEVDPGEPDTQRAASE